MTTGVQDFTVNPYILGSKSWNGTDGKHQFDGSPKFNAYSMTYQYMCKGPIVTTFSSCKDPDSTTLGFNFSAPDDGSVSNLALNKLGNKIRGTSMDLGNFLATGKQAYDQTISTVAAFGGALANLKRGNLAGALQNLGMIPGQRSLKHMHGKLKSGDISGTWLAMQYGWLPTLQDVYDLWNSFAGMQAAHRSTRFSASKKMGSEHYIMSGGPYGYRQYEKYVRKINYVYYVTETVSQARSLGLYDPVGILWEVLPYSFVIDWFIPISTYLDNLSIFPFVSGLWIKSNKLEKTATFAGTGGNPYSAYTCPNGGYGDLLNHYVGFSRTWGTSAIDVPRPGFKTLPQALSPKHLLNAVALAHQGILRAKPLSGKFSPF